MATIGSLLLIYLLGGVTFIPLCLVVLLCLAVYTSPKRDLDASSKEQGRSPSDADADADDGDAAATLPTDLPPELKPRVNEPDVAAGYFAVCREYVPGGINGKPPERTTPAGAVVGIESPSVYQSMYRSIFDRNRAQGPSIEGGKATKGQKKARNVFFVVLRHGHLILFDDSEQLEVRHVISLAHRTVDVYDGGGRIPEGELWIKRNCIRLRDTHAPAEAETESRPFYLFSENCSDKEDFYFALLRNQERNAALPVARPLNFDQAHIVKLVQQLHASEENLQTRWINALIGRLFLALYKTSNVEDFIRLKITKKIARVTKPAFIQSINIQRIHMGDSAPLITNPKLRELTLDGDLTAEADVKYNGNFRLEIAAVARIDLGTRFKARHVNMVLAGILKKLEGHILIRVKPPPSTRLWMTFEFPPRLEMAIEPIVSSRQITYGVILRAIESRIREVIAETLVLPNWDDMPFFDTISQELRGGVWEAEETKSSFNETTPESDVEVKSDPVDGPSIAHEEEAAPQTLLREDEKTMSMPNLTDPDSPGLTSRKKKAKSVYSMSVASDDATASGTDARPSGVKPKSMRSSSFASIASPVVNSETATVEALKAQAKLTQLDAVSAMKDISSRSHPTSPTESPVGSPVRVGHLTQTQVDAAKERLSSISKTEDEESIDEALDEIARSTTDFPPSHHTTTNSSSFERSSLYSNASTSSAQSDPRAAGAASARKMSISEKRQMLNMSLNSATSAAKKWFATRQANAGTQSSSPTSSAPSSASKPSSSPTREPEQPGTPEQASVSRSESSASRSQPIGRGQPLPPPGTPLPPPPRPDSIWGQGPLLGLTKRKPVAAPSATQPPPPPLQAPPAHPLHVFDDAPPSSELRQRTPTAPVLVGASDGTDDRGTRVPPPLPPRRNKTDLLSADTGSSRGHDRSHSRKPSGTGADKGDFRGENILVIAAPIGDPSAPPTPAADKDKFGNVLRSDQAAAGHDDGDGDAEDTGEEASLWEVELDPEHDGPRAAPKNEGLEKH